MIDHGPDWLTNVRPCLRERKAITEARWDFIARYIGYRTPAWIGKCLGLTAQQVIRFCRRQGVCATTRDDVMLSGEVADLLGCSQQWVIRLIKQGRLRGWRNPGGKWWLISRQDVQRYLRKEGKRDDDIRLTAPSGWPKVKPATHRKRRKTLDDWDRVSHAG